MKRAAVRFVSHAAAALGVNAMARALTTHRPRILMYHGFCGGDERHSDGTPADAFREQVAYLKANYQPLSLGDLIRASTAGQPAPSRAVVITVDDGYANFSRFAFPILRQFGVPATLFVVSHYCGGEGWIWTDHVKYLAERAATTVPELSRSSLEATKSRLKRLGAAERDAEIAALSAAAGIAIPSRPPERFALLQWDELRELAASGLVEIGSHTRTHPILAHADAASSWDEIHGSRDDLIRTLGIPADTFCYPNGTRADFRDDQAEMVQKAGYIGAVTTETGLVGERSDPYALPRFSGNQPSMLRFRRYVDGIGHLLGRS